LLPEVISTLSDYIATLGLDVFKEKFQKPLDEKKLKKEIKTYIESQRKYNDICSLNEEIDFQSLFEYVTNNLFDTVMIRLFDPNSKKRGQARTDIISAAISQANATTPEAKKSISKYISCCLDIIHNFYKSQLSLKDYVLASEITDSVTENTQDLLNNSIKPLYTKIDDIHNEIQNNVPFFSIDKIVSLAEKGDYSSIGHGFKKSLDHISLTHPLYPDFGFGYTDGGLYSKPLSETANYRFPSRMVVTGSIRFGDKQYNNKDIDPFEYSYHHQKPITIDVTNAIKYLGQRLDPIQDAAMGLIGNTIIAFPPKFPSAFPCSIKVGSQIFYEYVLLRLQEIEDDGTYIINNKEQNISLFIEIRSNPILSSETRFTTSLKNASTKDLLTYVRFIDALSKQHDLHIHLLSTGKRFFYAKINGVNYKTGFDSIDNEIDFLERLCDIEDYFHVLFSPDGDISYHEYTTVKNISELIRNDTVTGTWEQTEFKATLSPQFRKELSSMNEGLFMISYVGVIHITLFKAEFDLKFMRTYKCAHLVDYEKLMKKVEVLDDGDEIKFTFQHGEDNTSIDSLKIPDKIKEQS